MSNDNPFLFDMTSAEFSLPGNEQESYKRCIKALVETRPWVRFFGILCAIFCVLCLLGSLIGGVAIFFDSGILPGVAVMGGYLLIAIFYFFAAKWLLGSASAISRVASSHLLSDMAIAIERQKSFWKLLGAVVVTIIASYLAIGVIALLAMLAGFAV